MNLLPMEVVAMDGNTFDALILPPLTPPPPPLIPLLLLVDTVTSDAVVVVVVVVTVLSATGACMSQPLRLLLLDD